MSWTSSAAELFRILNEQTIRYCMLEMDEHTHMLDIFVHTADNARFKSLLETHNYKKTGSSTERYNFIYRLEPDAFWESEDGLLVHSACQMSCDSLSNLSKCKLPLDEKIQHSLWANRVWDSEAERWVVSPEDHLIHLLADCVFTQKCFSDASIAKIQALSADLESETLIEKLEGVFFRFTPELLRLVKEKRYERIIHDYKTFSRY